MEEYRVSLSQFEGPLDLLLHLIDKAEINIEDIFVSEITAQYLAYMDDLSELDMDRASSFLTVAAQLLLIKSRSLLPRPPVEDEEEEDPKEALLRQLREYKAFKEVSGELHERFEEAKKSFTRLPEDVVLPPQKFELNNASIDNLYQAFLDILNREDETEEKVDRTQNVRPDTFTVRDRVMHLRTKLKDGRVRFTDLFTDASTRMEKVVTFMALLEMLARGEVHITQGATFAPIYIRAKALQEGDSETVYMDEVED
jgi:segregation and condensation protein A